VDKQDSLEEIKIPDAIIGAGANENLYELLNYGGTENNPIDTYGQLQELINKYA